MKVSIITVTYNSARYLQHCIDSVTMQDYKDIEHIIIDGNSSDGTQSIIKKNTSISKYISEPDKSLYHAMNKGLKLATGDVVGFLNSDDFYTNNSVIKNLVNAIGDAQGVYADLCYVNSDNINKITRYWKSGVFRKNSFKYGWMPPHPTVFLRSEVYKKLGVFNLSLGTSADYELLLRVFHKYNYSITYLPELIIKMREGGVSNMSFINRLNAIIQDQKAWRINGLKTPFFLFLLKPIRKIIQYFKKP